MSTIPILDWSSLDAASQADALRRPAQTNANELFAKVRSIIDGVRARGDIALAEFTEQFDGVRLASFAVSDHEYVRAEAALSDEQKFALDRAIRNVERFHEAQKPTTLRVEIESGVVCEQISRPIDAVGLYVPAGTAPLPSAAIMLAVPARIAGCETRVLCTPPRKDGSADPAVLVAAKRCGVKTVFKLGGAQAVAAMAYGTASIPKVDKIFGPGNSWVTAAKILVSAEVEGAALDLPAGPSEVLVLADASARAEFVAADLLAQAEHSADAQAIVVTTDRALAQRISAELAQQLSRLSRNETLQKSMDHARIIVATTVELAVDIVNQYAPEHLILQTREPRALVPRLKHAGSIFIGAYTPETLGDYCTGANHVLPTYGFARAFSGLSLADFMKRMTIQELTADGLRDLGPTAVTLANLEGLDAHANAVNVRLAALKRVPS